MLEERVSQLEKEVAELKDRIPVQPEPKVLFEKVLRNGAKVVFCNTPEAVGMHIDGHLKSDVSAGQQIS